MGTKNLNSATDLITFTRASGGTALRKVSYGSELVTNGDFDTDISGWTAVGDAATTIEFSDGELLATAATTLDGAYQIITPVIGKLYKATCNLRLGSSSAARLVVQPNEVGHILSADGVATVCFVAESVTTTIRVDSYAGTGTFYADNISVKEVTFDQPDGTLQLFNSPANEPRIEYDADGTVKGLLIEEARTNLLTYSEDFSNGNWSEYLATVNSNVTTAPDGSNSADSVVSQGSEGAVYRTVTASGNHTWSIYAKAFSTSYLKLRTANTGEDTSFNLSGAGSVGTSNSNHTASIESVGDGWYRCVITSNSTNNRFSIYAVASDNANSASGDSLYLYGAQLEAGAFPTSYIPTTGSTATRAADLAQIPTSAFGYNNDKGSLVIDVLTPDADQFMILAYFNTASYLNSRGFAKANTSSTSSGNHYVNTTFHDGVSTLLQLGTQTQAEYTKLGLSYGDNEKGVRDGGTVLSGTSLSPSPTRLFLGGRDNGLQSQCWIKSLKYYPRQLTNTQLQELTT